MDPMKVGTLLRIWNKKLFSSGIAITNIADKITLKYKGLFYAQVTEVRAEKLGEPGLLLRVERLG